MSNRIQIKIPSKDEKLAEFIGIMLGDGNIFLNKDVAQVRITCNSEKESEYVIDFVKPLMKNIFGVHPQIAYPKFKKAIVLKINSVNLVKFLISCDLMTGNKVKNEINIPSWIKNDNNLLKACIRGLIDTDGSLYRLTPHWPNLYQLSFKSNSKRLLKDVHQAFIKFGFHPSKIFENRIVITRQKEINNYFNSIGSNNLKYSPVV